MEDMFQVLLTVAFIVIGVVSQFRKEKKEEAIPDASEMTMPNDCDPMMDCSDETIPAATAPAPPAPKPFQPLQKAPERPRKIRTAPTPPPTAVDTTTHEADDYNIHNVEEVRRAIIWSEILHRKY